MRFGIAAVLLIAAASAARAQGVVAVYNAADNIDPAALVRFEQQTGLRVQYDVYDSAAALDAKSVGGRTGYDVIIAPNEPAFSRLIKAGALQPIDRARVPRIAGLDPNMMSRAQNTDPGNHYGAVYLWGTVGLAYNAERLRKLAPDAKTNSWELLFKPANAKRLAECGIAVMDSPAVVIPSALRFVGREADSQKPGDLAAAEKALTAVRPSIREFAADGSAEALAKGDLCLALTTSSDAARAQARAKEAGRGQDIRYVAPREGAPLILDLAGVTRDAPHPYAAFAFLDFLLRPEIMGAITNKVRKANAVPASRPWVQPDVSSDASVYPPPLSMADNFMLRDLGPAAQRQHAAIWAKLKAAPPQQQGGGTSRPSSPAHDE